MKKEPAKTSPTLLIVLDGWGYREDARDNAVAAAKKPFFDTLWRDQPHCLLEASGLAVAQMRKLVAMRDFIR